MISRIRYWLHCHKFKPEHELKWPDLPVKHLVYFRDHPEVGAYIVFIDHVDDLDWRRDDKAEEFTKSANYDCHVSELQSEVSALEPLVKNWPTDVKCSAKRILGEALATVFGCDRDNAWRAIKKAKQFIRDKGREVSRYWTLKACTAAAGIAGTAGLLAVWQSAALTRTFGHTAYLLFLAAAAGAVGALLSVILRLGNLIFDTSAEKRLHYAEGVTRIIAGAISGALVGALVKIGVFLPVFTQTEHLTTAICAAALIAGASERMVPTIIAKLETTESQTNGDKT